MTAQQQHPEELPSAPVVAIMGPPNAGKGSQGTLLAERLKAAHLSTGALLRSENDPRLMAIMAEGKLVPSEDFERIFKNAIAAVPPDRPIVLDGIARKPGEAKWVWQQLIEHGRHLDRVIFLNISRDVSHERSLARSNQPGGEVRADDSIEVQEERWARYFEETMRTIEFFRSKGLVVEVDGLGSREEVANRIQSVLGY